MQKNSPQKSKFGKPLGFRTSDHFRGSVNSPEGDSRGKVQAPQAKFNTATFKTQHKG